jgi:glutathione S-transferase
MDKVLSTQDWLVRDKCSYADLSFFAWQRWVPEIVEGDLYERFPHVGAWFRRMEERPAAKKVVADQERAIAAMGRGN